MLIFTLLSFVLSSYAVAIEFTPELTGDASEILYEDTAKRDEYTRHYVMGDGSYIAVSYAEQVNYLDGDGEWVAVNNSFSKKLTGMLENGNERFKLKFSNHADGNKLVSIKTDDYKVSWKLKFSYDGENYVVPEKSVAEGSGYADVPTCAADVTSFGNAVGTVKYSDILSSVDLKYTVYQGKIKEDIILLENTGLYSYIAEYKVEDGVMAIVADDGSVGFYRDGDLLYYLASPYMYDATGTLCYGISVEAKQEKKTVTVKYNLDTEWLSASERVYPVVIDPTVTSSQGGINIQTAYLDEKELPNITDNHYNQSPIWVEDNQNVAYVEIFNVPQRPAFSTVLGAALILHAEETSFGVLDGTPISFYAQTVAEEWDSGIGYNGDVPALFGDSISAREEQGSAPLYVEFNLPINDNNYESYFENSHGFKLSAINLNAYFYGAGAYAPAILLRYSLSSEPSATGIISGKTYFLKNSASNKYFGVSDYLTDNGDISVSKNVFQKSAGVNDQYSRGVKINYFTTTGEYRLLSALSDYGKNQYIYSDGSGNVTYGEGSTAASNSYWNIRAVDGGLVIYKLDNGIYKALTAVGSADNGNIILSEYVEGNTAQLWTVEQVTINHHIINRSVTKKNIGAGEEWIFKLSASEMTNGKFTTGTPSISRSGFAKIQKSGNTLIVKVLPQDDTTDNSVDNFAIITLPVTEKNSDGTDITENRVVVIQNSGTTNGGGCTTIPIEADSTLRTVTLNEGETAEYILTFKSSLGNVQISEWEIFSNYGGIEFAEAAEKEMVGSNFAIIELLRDDIAIINAYKSNGERYTLVIECKSDNSSNEYRKIISKRDTTSFDGKVSLYNNSIYYLELNIEPEYVDAPSIRAYSVSAKIIDCWNSIANVVAYGEYYCIVQTDSVLADLTLEIELNRPVNLYADGWRINVSIVKSPNQYFEGTYYVRNRDSELYLSINDNGDQTANEAFMELHKYKKGEQGKDQRWIFEYLDNGYYHITSELSGLALMVEYGKENTEDYKIIQGVCNPDSYNQQWKIEQTQYGSYKFTNRASESADNSLVMCMGGTLGNIDFEGTNVENRPYNNNNSFLDEWEIVRKRGYRITNYIDKGFLTERCYATGENPDWNEAFEKAKMDIERSYSVVSYVLYELFDIELILYYENANECSKIDAEGHVCSDSNCKLEEYHSSVYIRDYFKDVVGNDGKDKTFALWSNYTIYYQGDTVTSKNKNRSFSSGNSIFMLNTYTGSFNNLMLRSDWMSVTLTLIHEISHQLSAPDHYCELDEDGNCKHAQYCETDFHEHESKASRNGECIMDNGEEVFVEEDGAITSQSRYWENLSNRVYSYVYCIECENDIREYLWGEVYE